MSDASFRRWRKRRSIKNEASVSAGPTFARSEASTGLWIASPLARRLPSGAQRLDTGQGLAFHPFEKGAAGGRHIGEITGDAGGVERGHRIAAARHRNELMGLRAFGDMA